MNTPDGPTEREAFYEEHYAALDEIDCDEEINASYVRDAEITVPTFCVVNEHTWHTNQFGLTFCQACGQDQWDELR